MVGKQPPQVEVCKGQQCEGHTFQNGTQRGTRCQPTADLPADRLPSRPLGRGWPHSPFIAPHCTACHRRNSGSRGYPDPSAYMKCIPWGPFFGIPALIFLLTSMSILIERML